MPKKGNKTIVGGAESEDDRGLLAEMMGRPSAELHECFAEGNLRETETKKNLERLIYGV